MNIKKRSLPWILGLSLSHNGSACLLKGDKIVVAIQEERLTRKKRQRIYGSKRILSIDYCLKSAGISARDLSMVVCCVQGKAASTTQDIFLNSQLRVGSNGIPVKTISHHMGHAVSAFALSGFSKAQILVIDGMGSPWEDLSEEERSVAVHGSPDHWEINSVYSGAGTDVQSVIKHMADTNGSTSDKKGMPFFRSIGQMYSAVSSQIFGSNQEAGKVMGLAAYGRPTIPASDFFEFNNGVFVFKDTVPHLFCHNRHWPNCEEDYKNLAASVQAALEQAVFNLVGLSRQHSETSTLCYAGGVALNCVLNERIIRESGYNHVFIAPFAEDSGASVGAAYYGLWSLTGRNTQSFMKTDSLGHVYSSDDIEHAIASVPGVKPIKTPDLLDEVTERMIHGQIGGWFQGGCELGPRALGHRSIIADPRGIRARETINNRIKRREPFRPFAPSVLMDQLTDWFFIDGFETKSPFMLRSLPFYPEKAKLLASVCHADGTGRVQSVSEDNGLYRELIRTFYDKTGIPMILNTSFNIMGEPIVETPKDALWCMVLSGLDYAVLENLLVTQDGTFESILDLTPRVTVREIKLRNPGASFRLDVLRDHDDKTIEINTDTPWGKKNSTLSPFLSQALACIDGVKTGHELLDEFKRRTRTRMTKDAWIYLLNELRRSNAIRFE